MRDDPGTLLVELSAQPDLVAEHRQRPAAAGELTLLAGGLWVLRNLYENASPGAAMAGAVVVDTGRWFGSKYNATVPKTELIVTTSVSSHERYYAQVSSAYYTTQSDWGLYARNAQLLPVKGACDENCRIFPAGSAVCRGRRLRAKKRPELRKRTEFALHSRQPPGRRRVVAAVAGQR